MSIDEELLADRKFYLNIAEQLCRDVMRQYQGDSPERHLVAWGASLCATAIAAFTNAQTDGEEPSE